MTALIPTAGNNLPTRPDGFSRAEGKALQAATNREVALGIVKNTQLSVANYLTVTAMQHTAGLAHQAYALADGDEYLAARLGALVDGYVTFARDSITNLRRMA